MTAVEYILNLVVGEDEQGKDVRVKDTISKSEIVKAKEMDKEQKKFIFECGRNFQLTGEGTFEEVYNETFKSE